LLFSFFAALHKSQKFEVLHVKNSVDSLISVVNYALRNNSVCESSMLSMFQEAPLLAIFVFTFLALFLAFEGGLFLGKRHRLAADQNDRAPIGSIVAATLGLLAFLLAFTFGITASKFDERRTLVIEEANAIGTTYLRAGYLPEPYQTEIRKLLTEYVPIRLEAIKPGKLADGIKRSEELQDLLWLQAVAIAEKNPDSVVAGLFISSLNELIDLHTKRVNIGVYFRLPLIIWSVLFFVTVLAIGSVGYQIGLSHARYLGITSLLILTFSSVFVLIVDLDRPQEGFIQVSQQSLIDLMDKFSRNIKQTEDHSK
jgi:hypothetical protein